MDKLFYTYLWLREDGTPYYVGKGHGDRAFRKGSPPVERILLQEHPSEQAANDAEVFLISYYGRKDTGTGILRNRTSGGEGTSGLIFTSIHRARLGTANHYKPTFDERHRGGVTCGNSAVVSGQIKQAQLALRQNGKLEVSLIKARHTRYHVNRGIVKEGCPLCK